MAAKGPQTEKPKPLGDRVYKKHRKMLEVIGRKAGKKGAEALRFAIEFTHESIVGKPG